MNYITCQKNWITVIIIIIIMKFYTLNITIDLNYVNHNIV